MNEKVEDHVPSRQGWAVAQPAPRQPEPSIRSGWMATGSLPERPPVSEDQVHLSTLT
jgi:hypothetical protein